MQCLSMKKLIRVFGVYSSFIAMVAIWLAEEEKQKRQQISKHRPPFYVS